jgi:Zn-dependent M16 (insulinase) family peptidase
MNKMNRIEDKIDKYLQRESIGNTIFTGIGNVRSKYFNTRNIDSIIKIVTKYSLTKFEKYAALKMLGFSKKEVSMIEDAYRESLKTALDNYGSNYEEGEKRNFGGIVFDKLHHSVEEGSDLNNYLKKHMYKKLKNKIKFDK